MTPIEGFSYPTAPDLSGHPIEACLTKPEILSLSQPPIFLDPTHPTLIALRQKTDPNTQIALLADEQKFNQGLNLLADQLRPLITQPNNTFFAYTANSAFRLNQEIHRRLKNLVPSPSLTATPTTPEFNAGVLLIHRTHGTTLAKSGATIQRGFEVYDISEKHIVIFEELLDSGYTIITAINNAIEHGASSITLVSLLNKVDAQDNIQHPPKTIIASDKIPIQLLIAYGVDRSLWLGGWGCDYQDGIGRQDNFLGVKY